MMTDLVWIPLPPARKATFKTERKETTSKVRAAKPKPEPEDTDTESSHSSDCDCSDSTDRDCSDSDNTDNWTEAEDDLDHIREILSATLAKQRTQPELQTRRSHYVEVPRQLAISRPGPNNIGNASVMLIKEVYHLHKCVARYISFPHVETERLLKLARDMAKVDRKLRAMRYILIGSVGTHEATGRAALQALERSGIAQVVVDLMAKAARLAQRSRDFRHHISERSC